MYTPHSKLAGATERVHTLPTWILFFRLYFNPRGEGQALFRCWSCYAWVLGATCAVRVRPGCPIRSQAKWSVPEGKAGQATCDQEPVRVLRAALFCCFSSCLETAWRVRSNRQQGPDKGSANTSVLWRFCQQAPHGRKKCPKLCDANKFVSSFG